MTPNRLSPCPPSSSPVSPGATRARSALPGAGWLLSLLLLLAPADARAQELAVEGLQAGVAEMSVAKGGHEASFQIRNAGPAPAVVKVSILGGERDVRVPPRVSAGFDGKGTSIRLEAGASQKVVVRWIPGQMREVYGHVALDVEGKGTRLVGLHGELTLGLLGRLDHHWLSLLLLAPLLGGLLGGALGSLRGERWSRPAFLGGACVQLALATWLLTRLVADFGRSEGNEGLQFVERSALGPVEFHVGADGASMLVVWLIAAASILATSRAKGPAAAGIPAAAAGLSLAALSQDLALLWAGLLAGLAGLVAASFSSARETSKRLAALAALSLLALGGAFWALAGRVDMPLLMNGATPPRCFSLAAILRSEHVGAGLSWAGQPFAAGVFSWLLVGSLLLLPLPLARGWLAGLLERSSAAVLALGALPAVAMLTLARVGALAIPEGLAWASSTVAWIGAASALLSGAVACAEGDLRRRIVALLGVQAGIGLVGLGAGSPQGIQGALVAALVGGAGAALAASAALLQEERLGSASAEGPGGLGQQAPWWAAALAAGLLVAAGAPGLAGFWGPAMALDGALGPQPGPALVAALGWAAGLWAATSAARAVLTGAPAPSISRTPQLEPHGGKFFDLRGLEAWTLLPALALALLLGFFPGLLLGPLERWARDLASFLVF